MNIYIYVLRPYTCQISIFRFHLYIYMAMYINCLYAPNSDFIFKFFTHPSVDDFKFRFPQISNIPPMIF